MLLNTVSTMSNPLVQLLVVIIITLLVAIGVLAYTVMGAAQIYLRKYNTYKKEAGSKVLLLVFAMMLSSGALSAQTAGADPSVTAALVTPNMGGLSDTALWALLSVIGLEFLVLLWLLFHLKSLLKFEFEHVHIVKDAHVKKPSRFLVWWDTINKFRPVHEEADIDLGHDYDGIRELDNRLPPWWLYGFYICIVFAGIYLYRNHVSHAAPSSKEELGMSLEEAAIEKEVYLKKAANKVDENTVTYLTDASALEVGKKIFTTTCAACHAADGGGMVGPNLTDSYWIHGGSIVDIFKTIKYGWPEKGMKSWQEDYSPVQMAQLSSYVKSLTGTKPAKAKEPQGNLFSDSTNNVAKKDTTTLVSKP
jgi:cytochrome c oxidase cbb3-type subunit 3